jgi:hypothetical protein
MMAWVRKLFVRLGLRGRHPHPPAPPPASGRGGAAIERARSVRCCGAWVCAVTTLTPRPPLPPAGEGEQRAF